MFALLCISGKRCGERRMYDLYAAILKDFHQIPGINDRDPANDQKIFALLKSSKLSEAPGGFAPAAVASPG